MTVVQNTSTTVNQNTVEMWADRIRPHLAGAVEHIVAAGRELIEAKAAMPHGRFTFLCNDLGITPRTAQRFMQIARHPVLSNPTQASHLPPSWSTLAELAQLNTTEVRKAIETKRITPKLDRGDARALVASFTTRRKKGEVAVSVGISTSPVPSEAAPVYIDMVAVYANQASGMLSEVLHGLEQAEVGTPLGLRSEADRAALSPLYEKIAEAIEVAEALVKQREADLQRRVELLGGDQ